MPKGVPMVCMASMQGSKDQCGYHPLYARPHCIPPHVRRRHTITLQGMVGTRITTRNIKEGLTRRCPKQQNRVVPSITPQHPGACAVLWKD
jgi:hypothetical protein